MAIAVPVVVTPVKRAIFEHALSIPQTAAVALDNSGLQDIFFINTQAIGQLFVRLTVATNALAAFAIWGKFDASDAAYFLLKNTFAAAGGILTDISGNIATQAVGTGWFCLNVLGLDSIKLQAQSGNVGGSTLQISGGGV